MVSLTDILVRPESVLILYKDNNTASRKGRVCVETKYSEAILVSFLGGRRDFCTACVKHLNNDGAQYRYVKCHSDIAFVSRQI